MLRIRLGGMDRAPETRTEAFDEAGLEAELLGTTEALREMNFDRLQLLGREGPVHVVVKAPERVPAGQIGGWYH
jgi:hypothetical protein